MKILIKGHNPNTPPKKKIMPCRFCGSLLKAERDDFRETMNALSELVWAVNCPVCGGIVT